MKSNLQKLFLDSFAEIAALGNLAKSFAGFPAMDILGGEKSVVFRFAVAGFDESELSVRVEDGVLVVRGEKSAGAKPENYIYCGIAQRSFSRQIGLPEAAVVSDASLVNGILTVTVAIVEPQKDIREIKITA